MVVTGLRGTGGVATGVRGEEAAFWLGARIAEIGPDTTGIFSINLTEDRSTNWGSVETTTVGAECL